MQHLCDFLDKERANWNVYPSQKNVFKAFRETPFDLVKVVILGQDPYPNLDHAMGLAFSVPRGVGPLPRSLRNIHRELDRNPALARDPDIARRKSGNLTWWAKQGVLLLNRALTVGADGRSHFEYWKEFTDRQSNSSTSDPSLSCSCSGGTTR